MVLGAPLPYTFSEQALAKLGPKGIEDDQTESQSCIAHMYADGGTIFIP